MIKINGIPPQQNSPSPPDPLLIIEQYRALYQKLLESNPPSKTAVQDLLNFIQQNRAALTAAGESIDYPPYPGAKLGSDLDALVTALTAYLQGAHNGGAVFEFAGNIRNWLGIGITPEDIYKAFEKTLLAFEKNPSRADARNLELFLGSHGYLNALAQFAHDGKKFLQDAAKANKLVQEYESDPTKEKAAEQAVQTLLGDL